MVSRSVVAAVPASASPSCPPRSGSVAARSQSVAAPVPTSVPLSGSPRIGGAVMSPVSAAAVSNGAVLSPPSRSEAAVVSARALVVEVAPPPSNAALFEEFLEFRQAKLEVQGAPPLVVDPQPGCEGCGRPLPVRCPGCAAGRVSADDWRLMSAPASRVERTDGSSPMAREGREERMSARWTQQQQQQQWRQPGQVGMAFGRGGGVGMASGGGGGFTRSPSGPSDARWSAGDSPPGLSVRSREDDGGEGAGGSDQSWSSGGGGGGVAGLGSHSTYRSPSPSPRQRDPRSPEDGGVEGAWGLEQPWAVGGGDGGVGGHGSYQPLSPSSRMRASDSRQWGGGGGESPTD